MGVLGKKGKPADFLSIAMHPALKGVEIDDQRKKGRVPVEDLAAR